MALTALLLLAPQGAAAISAQSSGSRDTEKKAAARDTITAKPQSAPAEAAPSRATTQKKSGTSLLDELRREVRDAKKTSTPRYDQFRDSNNDGVADRVTTKREPAPEEDADKVKEEPKSTKSTSSTKSTQTTKPTPRKKSP